MSDTRAPRGRPLHDYDDDTDLSRRRPSRLDAAGWVPALVVLVVISLGVAGYGLTRSSGAAGAATTPAGTITVTGTGTIEGTPNTVGFSIGIHTVASTAVGALDENNTQIARLEALFRRDSVATDDMQTTNVSIYEQTDDHGNFIGFAVDDDLQVTVVDVTKHNIHRAGAIIDAGVSVAGAGIQFNGISFSIANESTLLLSARERAMASALTVAKQLVSGTGETVGSIVKVTDDEGSQSGPFYSEQFGIAEPDIYAASQSVPIESGRQPVSVQVTVVYSLDT